TDIDSLSLHDALPILNFGSTGSLYTGFIPRNSNFAPGTPDRWEVPQTPWAPDAGFEWDHPINQHANRAGAYTQNNIDIGESMRQDRKSTRLNSSHVKI